MPTFAFHTTGDVRVRDWLKKVALRLETSDFLQRPFLGGIRSLGKGVYVMDIRPAYPRYVLNVILVFWFASAIALWIVGFPRLAFWLYLVGGALAVVVNAFWSELLYRMLIWYNVYRITRVWHRVRRADTQVLRGVVYGKV